MKAGWNHYFSFRSDGALRSVSRSFRHFYRRRIAILKAQRSRRASDSIFIGITGSSGKSTTTALLAHILKGHGEVHCQVVRNKLDSVMHSAGSGISYIDYVVAEVGTTKKGDIRLSAGVLQPNIAIVTYVGLEHYSSFRKREAVAEEKGALVEAITPGGFAVLNADDDLVMAMAQRTGERVVTFSRQCEADYRVVSATSAYPQPLKVDIVWQDGEISVETGLLGEHFWLSVVAAVATAIELGVDIEIIKKRCSTLKGVENRCQIFPTGNGPVFILDTAKAPWDSLPLAMSVIENCAALRKRVVLGQISDYAGSSHPKYRDAYRAARAVADQVIYTGDNAHRSKASNEDKQSGRFIQLQSVSEVDEHIRSTAIGDEVILLKSAQNTHLERVALAWKYDVKCWIDKCGKSISCLDCGLYEVPFEEHSAIERMKKRRQRRQRLMFWEKKNGGNQSGGSGTTS